MRMSHDLPYPSVRQPLYARNVVATSTPLAAQAGLEVMRLGGNAIDAAIATAAALTVMEPTSNGLGSDAFALIWAGGGLHGLNGSGRAPALMGPERYAGLTAVPLKGWGGVTVPGAVSAWAAAHAAFGALPFAACLAPAIRAAREGFPVSPIVSRFWNRAVPAYAEGEAFAEWRRVFAPQGRGPGPGEVVRLRDHADTLQAIAESGGAAFYTGELAAKMDAAARAAGGALRGDDLASHTAEWVRPISAGYRGLTLHEIPPNGQGLAALVALGVLEGVDVAALGVDSPAALHAQIEAMKMGMAEAQAHVADGAHMRVSVESLLCGEAVSARRGRFDAARAQVFSPEAPRPGGTVLLCTADAQGNMVSFIQSNYTGFGSGVVVPGTGVSLHNRGCCFTLEAGHPNLVGPGKRPYHTIIPGFVTRGNEPVMAFGVMGGFMQPQGHVQVLSRLADFGQNPQAALDAPRWQVSSGREVSVEAGVGEGTIAALRAMGHEVRVTPAFDASFGRGQCVVRTGGGGGEAEAEAVYLAASDPRADGTPVGM